MKVTAERVILPLSMPPGARARRQERLEAQTANSKRKLDLQERELRLREAEIAARTTAQSGAFDTPAQSPELALEGALARLLSIGMGRITADIAEIRALEAWLRGSGHWGADPNASATESTSLRDILSGMTHHNPNEIKDSQGCSLNVDLTNIKKDT